MSAQGLCFFMASFSKAAFFKSLAGITNLTPLFANALAVSAPIPDVAPAEEIEKNFSSVHSQCKRYLHKKKNLVTFLSDCDFSDKAR